MKITLVLFTAASALAQDATFVTRDTPVPGTPATRFVFARAGEATVKGAPYSADTVTESTQTLADGNRIVHRNKTSFARDSQGRTRREMQIQGFGRLGQADEAVVNILIDDPVAATQYHLDPRAKTVVRTHASAAAWKTQHDGEVALPAARMGTAVFTPMAGATAAQGTVAGVKVRTASPGRIPGKLSEENLGERMFEGLAATGRRLTMTITAGAEGNEKPIEIVTETWHSDQLKTAVYTRHYDPRFGETITKLVNVQVGEPSAHLFQVPADYKEGAAAPARIILRDEL